MLPSETNEVNLFELDGNERSARIDRSETNNLGQESHLSLLEPFSLGQQAPAQLSRPVSSPDLRRGQDQNNLTAVSYRTGKSPIQNVLYEKIADLESQRIAMEEGMEKRLQA